MDDEPATSRAALRIALLVALVPYLTLALRFRFLTDDAYITFRYAKNLATGLGPCFNPAREVPVEGYSNFLWMLVCAGLEALGLAPPLWGNVLSLLTGVALVALFLVTLVRRLSLPLAVALPATLVLGLHAPFAVWSTGGLATMPFALLLFLSFERLLLRPGGPHVPSAAAALLGLGLVRVEGVFWAALVLLLALLSRRARGERAGRALAASAGLFLAGYAAYLAWRLATYGSLVPNTVVVKSGSTLSFLARGLDYVASSFLTSLNLWVLLPGTLSSLRRGRRALGLPVAVLAWAFPVWSIAVSGDFMAFGRFLVPGWPFTCVLAAWLLADLSRLAARPAVRAAVAWSGAGLLVVLGLLPAFDVHPVPEATREAFRFRFNRAPYRTELGQWHDQQENARSRAALGRALARFVPAGSSIVAGNVGAVGYYSGLFVHDQYGLVSPEVTDAESSFEADTRSPGHDRRVEYDFFLKEEPDVLEARLIEGLPGLERLGEAESRRRFGLQFEKQWIEAVADAGLADRYVADFRPLDGEEGLGDLPVPNAVLAWWRRVAPGTAEAERAGVRQKLAAWCEGRWKGGGG